MMFGTAFHFLRPAWLLALLPLSVALWRLWKRRRSPSVWESVCDPALIPYILIGGSSRHRSLLVLMASAGALAVVALAGPAWTRLPQPAYRPADALVLVLDLSPSMDARDISPSRLERARFKLADVLRARQSGQTALVVYADDAFTVTPLTDDTATIAAQLAALSPAIMPKPGDRADAALPRALDLLRNAGMRRGQVLLLTDSAGSEADVAAAERLRAAGYRTSVFGIGTVQGAPVPLPGGGLLKDEHGGIVVAALAERPLTALAEAGGGRYQAMTLDNRDVTELMKQFSTGSATDVAMTHSAQADRWREEGPWLILLLLPLAALAFRRGYLFALVFCLLPAGRDAHALEWADWWLTPDQQAKRAWDRGDAEQAAKTFDDRRWKGAAQYRTGDYTGAAQSLADLPGVENRYNQANALAKQGRYEEAVAQYDEALTLDPKHADAKHNRDLVLRQLQQQTQAQQPGSAAQDDRGQSGDKRKAEQEGEDAQQDSPSNGSQTPSQADTDAGQDSRKDQSPSRNGSAERAEADAAAAEPKGATQGDPADQAQGKAPDELNPTPSQDEKSVQDESHSNAEQQAAIEHDASPDEQQQAMEQWLRRVPDDPAGLLRRKFQYQARQRQARERGARP